RRALETRREWARPGGPATIVVHHSQYSRTPARVSASVPNQRHFFAYFPIFTHLTTVWGWDDVMKGVTMIRHRIRRSWRTTVNPLGWPDTVAHMKKAGFAAASILSLFLAFGPAPLRAQGQDFHPRFSSMDANLPTGECRLHLRVDDQAEVSMLGDTISI